LIVRNSPSWLVVLPAILLGGLLERAFGSAQPPCPIGEAPEIHYSPAEDLERIDVALIGEAAKQIDMAACVLTDSAVVEALREASARGVKVRVWRDANMAERVGELDVESQLGGRVQGLELRSNLPGGELMHLKGYCVDHRLLRTGSANSAGQARRARTMTSWRCEARRSARGLRPSSTALGSEVEENFSMCNDYRLLTAAAAIFEDFSQTKIKIRFSEGKPNLEAREDIKIKDTAPFVRAIEGEPEAGDLVQRRWSWPGQSGKPVYNFRSEGREFASGRCLILADGLTSSPIPPTKRRSARTNGCSPRRASRGSASRASGG
jgi:hypothetical protein